MQCLWLYEKDVDLAALDRTYRRLCALPGNRLIEPSPVPFGRHRWVRASRPLDSVQYNDETLPRSSLLRWANAHARMPIDPVGGPAWLLGVQRFSDGSSAVSLVGSHLLFDGVSALRSIEAAIDGTPRESAYLPKGARRPIAALVADLAQALVDVPQTLRALVRLAPPLARRVAHARRPSPPPAVLSTPAESADGVSLPAVAVMVGAQQWAQRARQLGGHKHGLLLAFAARVAMHMGRRRPSDGAVRLVMTVNQRRATDDDRALAISFSTLTVDPLPVADDLRSIEQSLKAALRAITQEPDAMARLFPVVPWMPRLATAALLDQMFSYADGATVSCSNLGELPGALARIDGTICHRLLTRAVDVNVTPRDLARTHGHLVIVSSRINGTLSLCIEGYQLGTENTTEQLCDVAERTLAEFGLDGVVEC